MIYQKTQPPIVFDLVMEMISLECVLRSPDRCWSCADLCIHSAPHLPTPNPRPAHTITPQRAANLARPA